MKKLRNVLAAALVTIPLSLNAGIPAKSEGAEMRPTPSVAGCCYYYIGGRWWCIPC